VVFSSGLSGPFDAIASGIKTAAQVAADPRTQAVANVAAQQYAPQQYANIQAQTAKYTAQAKAIHNILTQRPGAPIAQRPMPMQMPMQRSAPIKQGNILTIAAIGGVAIILLLVMRK
jgi:hypothetical protein